MSFMLRKCFGLIFRNYCSHSSADMVKVLNVAEKNDAAKTLANVMSRGSARKREGFSKFNKIYEFNYNILNKNCLMMMTSVSGHLLELDFIGQYRKWYSCNPLSLFDTPVEKKCPENYTDIKRTLEREVRSSQYLIIWTDCDREGENIGFEVIQVCRAVNPNLPIYRARFSEITPQAVARACSNLVAPDKRVSDAVDVRQELDLRIGDNEAACDIKAVKNGELLYQSERVLACSVIIENDVFFTGIVSAAMKNKVIYSYKLRLEKESGDVLNSHCECPAGKGPNGTCKHLAACMIMLENFIENGEVAVQKSCTENLMMFNKPKASHKGAAFTRFQTMRLQKIFPEALAEKLISYGSCQFPTLGFVVERYKQVQAFIPEPFWKIKVTHIFDDATKCEFSWKRIRLFDHNACLVLYEQCTENPKAKVIEVKCKPKSKWRPVPLDTVEMEKLASRKLRISAKETMRIAESLYTKGFISYPRTETNMFPKDLDLVMLVDEQTRDPSWGGFARGILQDRPNPRNGNKTDQAHPPIHPIKYTDGLQGNDARLYEFIVRHFLATCSKDAQGQETTVTIEIADEKFSVQGLMITARHYLDVYPYDRWNAKTIPVYQEGDIFEPNAIDMLFSETSPPPLLTEADLISLMEKHGIGTDATHAEHIEKIKTRMYVGVNNDNRFVPGQLGMGLVEGYDAMGYEMSKPQLRAELEADLKRICDGKKDKNLVLSQQVEKYKEVFKVACQQALKIDQALSQYLGEARDLPVEDALERLAAVPVKKCPNCGMDMALKTRKTGGFYIGCLGFPSCRSAIWLPDFVLDASVSDVKCEDCQAQLMNFRFKMGSVPPMLPLEYTGCVAGCDDLLSESLQINKSAPLSSQRPPQQMAGSQRLPQQAATSQNRQDQRSSWSDAQDSQRVPLMTVQPFNRQTNHQDSGHSGQDIVCNCGTNAILLTVKKEGPNQGRQFYKCGSSGCNFFLWADESQNQLTTNNRRPPGGGGGFNNQNSDMELNCNCGAPAKLLRVTRDGPNKDREFYSCSKPRGQGCDFFQWADVSDENSGRNFGGGGFQGNQNVGNSDIQCKCADPAKMLTVNKEGPNKGRPFYACAKPRGQGCDFFQWADVTEPDDSEMVTCIDLQNYLEDKNNKLFQGNQNVGNSDVQCKCGDPAKMLTVNKEGPNKGRPFYACAKPRGQGCDFFQWGDENSKGGNPGIGENRKPSSEKKRTSSVLDSGNTSNKKRAARKCGLCGEEGHTKRTCPHK